MHTTYNIWSLASKYRSKHTTTEMARFDVKRINKVRSISLVEKSYIDTCISGLKGGTPCGRHPQRRVRSLDHCRPDIPGKLNCILITPCFPIYSLQVVLADPNPCFAIWRLTLLRFDVCNGMKGQTAGHSSRYTRTYMITLYYNST